MANYGNQKTNDMMTDLRECFELVELIMATRMNKHANKKILSEAGMESLKQLLEKTEALMKELSFEVLGAKEK